MSSEESISSDSKEEVSADLPEEEKDSTKDVVIPPITDMYHLFNVNLDWSGNLYLVEDTKLVTSSGNTLVFFDLATGKYTFQKGEGDDGIGALCVYHDKESKEVFVTVGNRGVTPSVFIHKYPSMEIVKELKNGTETSYSAMSFDESGKQLATVGFEPDFMMTIWDWRKGSIVLKCKAFGQDVFNVKFNPWLKGHLTTSGIGHIKFWKMSQTFTGLKLQGQVGKFGKVDISDIVGFVQFPDGKVLSGSEQGHLILWEENLVKVIFVVGEGVGCHNGVISYVRMTKDGHIMTCGHDSFIKFWNFEKIDTSEPSDTSYVVEIQPEKVLQVGEDVKIVDFIDRGEELDWVVQDGNGGIWTLSKDFTVPSKVFTFLSGRINCLDSSPNSHLSVAGSNDGSVLLVDHFKKEIIYSRKFNSAVTSVLWNPLNVDPSGRTITVGFANGVVRVLQICSDAFTLHFVVKPHNNTVTCLGFSPDGSVFSSTDDVGVMWFFTVEQLKFSYIGFAKLGSKITRTVWTERGVIASLSNSDIIMVEAPTQESVDTETTYEFQPSLKKYLYFQYLRPPKREKIKKKIVNEFGEEVYETDEEAEEAEQKKEKMLRETQFPVLAIQKSNAGGLYVSLKKNAGFFRYSGLAWESEKQKEREYPLCCLTRVDAICTSIVESKKGEFMAVGYENGKTRLITTTDEQHNRTIDCHDSHKGRITSLCTSFDDAFLMSVGEEGCFFVQNIHKKEVEPSELKVSELAESQDMTEDVLDINAWSIEESRIKSAEMDLKSKQEAIKDTKLKKIANLKLKFQHLLKENRNLIDRSELQIDRVLQENLEKDFGDQVEITRKKLEWISKKVEIGKKKLEDFHLNNLDYERIVVYGFKNGIKLSTFKTRELYEALEEEITKIQEIIRLEMERQEMERREKEERRRLKSRTMDKRTITTKTHHRISSRRSRRSQSTIQRTFEKSKQKAEELQKVRKELEIARNELRERKSRINEVDPQLLQKISAIEGDMGDFKLRMDENYVAPLDQRMTTQKKFTQMVLLEESMHSLKKSFNEKLLELREIKGNLVSRFEHFNRSIFRINKDLGIKEPPIHEVVHDDEFPEKRKEISQNDIDEFKLYLQDMEKQKDVDRGQMIFDRKADNSVKFSTKSKTASGQKTMTDTLTTMSKMSGSVTGGPMRTTREEIVDSLPVSEVEETFSEINRITKLYEKARLLEKKDHLKNEFDKSLEDFREEKIKLEADLKSAELKLLLLKSEYELLQQFEIKDQHNYRQLNEKREARSQILSEIQVCQNDLLRKRKEIKNLVKQEKVSVYFEKTVSSNHPAYDELKEIFIRSNKDDESVYSDDSESDNEEEMEEISKPEKCSDDLFAKVMDLRTQKLKQDEQIETISKSVDKLKRKREQLGKQKRNADAALEQINKNIQNVQREKQNELNKLNLMVVLKLSQLKSLVQRKIPKELAHFVVFTNRGLLELSEKEKQIAREIEREKKGNSRHRNKLKNIRNLHKNIKAELAKIKEKVREFQLLKFGQEVEYEDLILTIDPRTQRLREQLGVIERNGEVLIKKKLKEIDQLKEKLSAVTKKNTKYLSNLADLRENQGKIESEIFEAQNTMIDQIYKGMENLGQERLKKMKRIVLEQARKIENYRNEVAILRSKGTHVYSNN